MDNPEFQPPKPRSMSDAELEAALEQAKLQSDGMLGAMMLLEQESQLRAEDDAATAQWLANLKSDPRPEAQLAVTNYERSLQGLPATESSADEPVFEAAAIEEPTFEPVTADEVELSPVHFEDGHAFTEPEPIPAPTLEEAAFDELLAMGAAEATSGIDVVDDFSVTDVVGQIVTTVDEGFEAAPEESATALEEFEADSEIEPVSAFPKVPEGRASFWPERLSKSIVWSLLVPVLLLFWGASAGVSLATASIAFAVGSLISLAIGSVIQKFTSRGEHSLMILSRSSFGVYGNILPSLVILLFRVLLLVSAISLAVASMNKTIAGVDLTIPWNTIPLGSLIAALVLVFGLVISLLPARARGWAGTTVFALAAFWILFGAIYLRPTAWDFGTVDFAQIVLVTVVLVLVRCALGGFNVSGGDQDLPPLRIRVSFEVLIPLVVTVLFGSAVLVSGITSFDSSAFETLVVKSESWFGTFANVIAILMAITLASQLMRFASDALSAFFLPARVALVVTAVMSLAGLSVLTFMPQLGSATSGLLILLSTGATTWVGLILAETLLRRQSFHDVSLLRGYGFYRRISIFATLGFMFAMAFSVSVVPVDGIPAMGFASGYLDSVLIFGGLSAPALGLIFGLVWSLITALPKVHRQESDIAAVDERKQQIAGVDFPS